MQTSNTPILIFTLLVISIIFSLVVIIIFLIYVYKKKQASNAKKLELLELKNERDYMQTKLEIQEDTFNYISREIHDNINLDLTLAKLYLNTTSVADTDIQKKIDDAAELLGTAIQHLRDLSHGFNGDVIQSQGLLTALSLLIGRLKKLGNYHIGYEVSGETSFLDAKKELVVFRIVQESVNNILKHACATEINLSIDYQPKQLRITIQDNGKGISPKTGIQKSNGLLNMYSRARSIGGSFRVSPLPYFGTQSIINIPF